MHPHFARGESDVENTLWKDLFFFFFRRNVTFSPTDQDVYLFFFYLASYVVIGKKPNPNRNVVFSWLFPLHPALGQQFLKNFLNLWEQSQKASPMPCRLLGSNYLVDYLFMIKGFWLMFRDVTVLPMRGPVH